MKNLTLGILLFMMSCQITYGQTPNQQKAYEKGTQAIKLMDNGKFDESIKLLEEAGKLDPDDINYPYEIAYAYYAKGDYKKASKNLEDLLNHKDVHPLVYQLLGNSYDNLNKYDKALETYEAGLKLFPKAGILYLELGNMEFGRKEYNKALPYYEKGIQVEPDFPSNYYRAALIYCSSTEEVWGMIYGEIFMNLERNSKRTMEMSKLLYDTYKSEINFKNDTSFSVSFSKTSIINISDLSDPGNMKLPYGVSVYEPTLMFSMLSVKAININTLDVIRTNFVTNYFANGHDKTYPNVLFSYQKQIMEAGHLEAYNHWLLMKGDEAAFSKWDKENPGKFDNFVAWFTENSIQINDSNKFSSGLF